MHSIDQAIEAILRHAKPLPSQEMWLTETLGMTLGEDISADIDLPPFDKALMDGYAVRSLDLASYTSARLWIVEEITAGRMPTHALNEGETARIMTGAPLPPGADAVVMIERSEVELEDNSFVDLRGPFFPGMNRLAQGREMRSGEILLRQGIRLDPAKIGLIASAGRAKVRVIPTPSIVVVPTGDELVRASQKPGPGQIRNTNGVMLAGFARTWGASNVAEHRIAPDHPEGLRESLRVALSARSVSLSGLKPPDSEPWLTDVLLISGGVSAGSKDLVPATLRELGVTEVFHKVNVKPGKPLWFGVGPARGEKPGALVFGLPGNPVSGVVGFLLFVRPALEALAGRSPRRTQLASFRLGAPFQHRGDRPTYYPSRLQDGKIFPLDWAGSADLRTVALADGFACFPAGDRDYSEGEEISFLPLD